MQNLIFGPALFYDIPEYLQIVSSHTFWQVFSLGHFPIHPVFLGILWIFMRVVPIRIFPVNVIAMFFGLASIFIFYKIAKLIFKKGPFFLAAIIFAMLPGVWLINTNLMVESVTLTFYLAAIFFFLSGKKIRFLIGIFLMVGTHLESIFWIPAFFLLPFIFEVKFKKKDAYEFIKLAVVSVSLSILLYIALYYSSGRVPGGATEQLATYFSSGIFRMIRNAWLSFITDYGSLTPFILVILIIRRVKTKSVLVAWIAFFTLVGLIAANWQGDFMPRRIIFAAAIVALGFYKYLGKKSVFVVLYLLPIVAANAVLYSHGNPFKLPDVPKGEILVETHYLHPFTKYDGTVLWIGEDNLDKIDDYLKAGRRVFLTKQAVTAPYLLLVGNNYHITSLGKVGVSESKFLFTKYAVEPFGGSFELKLFNGRKSEAAGEPVVFYDQSFWGRLARRRIDYGDIGSWVWPLLTNHRDPTGWTYKDVRGIWYNM